MKPWDYHSDLSEQRLTQIGLIIAEERNMVFDLRKENRDDGWSLGCRAFTWCRNAISREASNGSTSWLTVLDSSMRFIFRIGDVPIRFFRGDADKPIKKTLASAYLEGEQFTLKFPGENRAFQLIWRFVVETDATGELFRVVFVGATPDGIPECQWVVPIFDSNLDDLPTIVTESLDPEDEVASPEVTLPRIDDAENE